jgi:hypothetical protein
MRKEIVDALAKEAERLDELYYELGDILDVKASIILVLATFLGTVSGQVLAAPVLSSSIKTLQVFTVFSLGAALILTVLALRIRKFDVPPEPDSWMENLAKWEVHYAKYERGSDWLLMHFEEYQRKLISERISTNRRLASQKSHLNKWALRAVATALTSEFGTLVLLALSAYDVHLRALLHF